MQMSMDPRVTSISKQSAIDVLKEAFRSPPWDESVPDEVIESKLAMYQPETIRFLGYQIGTQTLGATWYGIVDPNSIPVPVNDFLNQIDCRAPHVYFGVTAVLPTYQQNGIGNKLKGEAIAAISRDLPGAVLFTRMRTDNHKIIAVNSAHGFVKTGISETSARNGSVNEWWYRIS